MKKIAAVIAGIGAAVGITLGAGAAAADSSNPTVGDTVRYVFCSDVQYNGSTNWYDGDNDMQGFTRTTLHSHYPNKGVWCGQQTITSRSTYQLAAASIQTDGRYARCAIYVNGVQKDFQSATGRYAVATCAA
jgi:hypothetical protein